MPGKSDLRLMWLLCVITLLSVIATGCWEPKTTQPATANPGSAATAAPAGETAAAPSATPILPGQEPGGDYPYPESASTAEPAAPQAYPEQ